MIKKLLIRNYALLDKVDIDFTNGLTVLSGETGSGKSIMLDAISLLLGNRVLRFDSLKQPSKSIIEGVFYIKDEYKEFFKQNNLDFEKETIIRREIHPNSKSRAFINDTPVRLNILSLLGEKIMQIYDQNHSFFSTNDDFQFEFINHMSDSLEFLNEYNTHLNKLNQLNKDLQIINDQGCLSSAEIDFLQYQYDELHDINMQKNEKNELEREISLLENIDDIADAISESDILLNNEKGVLECLNIIKRKLINFDNFSDFHNRIDSVIIELNDLSDNLTDINNDLDLNPNRLVDLNHRLDLINGLILKHRVNSIEELIELKNDFQSRIELSRSFNDLLNQKKAEIMLCQEKLTTSASILNKNRNKSIPKVISGVENILRQLGMPHAKFDIRMDVKEGFTKNGNTNIEFYFSANKGRRMQEISKVASGGELSRLMLAIKYLGAKKSKINTLIFDEIDSGVSGQVASLMGDMMVEMSKSTQLISISHLPQIAAKANTHFKVCKNISNDKTSSKIIRLSEKERVKEIAKLLSGKRLTQAAIDNAIDLLDQ